MAGVAISVLGRKGQDFMEEHHAVFPWRTMPGIGHKDAVDAGEIPAGCGGGKIMEQGLPRAVSVAGEVIKQLLKARCFAAQRLNHHGRQEGANE